MPRPVLFIDLAGTLILRDPESRRWVTWTGAAGLLYDLSRNHDLHLTTGDSDAGARAALAELEVRDLFTGVHAGLPGGGKPFGALAARLGVPPEHCLALGDNPVSDTAGDSDRVVSLIVQHETAQVAAARVRDLVATLGVSEGFLAGFEAQLAAPDGALGEDCGLGWWQKTATQRRPVVTVTA